MISSSSRLSFGGTTAPIGVATSTTFVGDDASVQSSVASRRSAVSRQSRSHEVTKSSVAKSRSRQSRSHEVVSREVASRQSRSLRVLSSSPRWRAAVFSILALEVTDQAGQHLADLFVLSVQWNALVLRDVAPLNGDDELRSDLAGGSLGSIAVLRAELVGRLLEAFGNRACTPFGRGAQLLTKLVVAVERRTLDDRRNFSGRRHRPLINLQFFKGFCMHAEGSSTPRAAQPHVCTQS